MDTTETKTGFNSAEEWRAASMTALRSASEGGREYQNNNDFPSLVKLLSPMTELGLNIYLRRHKDVPADETAKWQSGYGKAADAMVATLFPDEAERAKFSLPEGDIDLKNWQGLARTHFGAIVEADKQLTTGKQGQGDMLKQAALGAAHLTTLARLVFTRAPAGQDQAVKAYREFYAKVGVAYLEAIRNKSAVEVATPAPPPPAAERKSEEAKASADTSELQRFVRQILNGEVFGINAGEVAKLPESLIATSSLAGARVERKGGEVGEGVIQRFKSLFLSPIDKKHPLLTGGKLEPSQGAIRQVSLRKAVAELFGAAVASRSGTEYRGHQVLLEEIARNPEIFRQMVRAMAEFKDRNQFGGLEDRLVVSAKEGTSANKALKVMNLMNEVFTSKTAREKLDLEQLLPHG